MSDATSIQYDVILIGLGPTGATLANLLGMCGVSVLILERESGIYPLPRAVHFDDEIMRVWQNVGIADALVSQIRINKGMRFCSYAGEVLLDWPRPQTVTDNGWHASYRFHQPDLELQLRAALKRFPRVSCKTQCTLLNIEQSGEREHSFVCVRYQDLRVNREVEVSAQYVVGCDGANSTVRDLINVGMQSFGFEQRWLVVDAELNHPMPALGDHTIQYCDPLRPATYCRNPGNRRRWEFALSGHQSDQQVTDTAAVWSLLEPWITPDDARLERQAVYTFKSEVAQRWRVGNVFLAGDAAHLTPPFMGQGMCAGIRDAANLAWKLACACNNTAAPALLASYETERKPNVIAYIKKAVELGELINHIGSDGVREHGSGVGSPKMKSIESRLGVGLGADHDVHRGRQCPQFKLNSGQLHDQQTGYRFVLLTKQTETPDVPSTVPVQMRSTLLANQHPELDDLLNRHSLDTMLVRPDHYILATNANCFSLPW